MGGEVLFEESDAVTWLRGQGRRFDAIVEDLSVPIAGDVVKPSVSWEILPSIMRRKVRAPGVLISNLLPTPGVSWSEMEHAVGRGPAVVVGPEEFYNRVLIQGAPAANARAVGAHLRGALRALGSELAEGLSVRTLRN